MAEPSPKHAVSVAAAVVEAGRLLGVRRRDNGRWEPPGGVLELSETIREGLVREASKRPAWSLSRITSLGSTRTCAMGSWLWYSAATSFRANRPRLPRPVRCPG